MNKHEPTVRPLRPQVQDPGYSDRSTSYPPRSERIAVAPKPAFYQPESIPENIMDLLVERYTSFAQLVARGKLQPMDVAMMRAICNQVAASAEDLERESKRRKHIVSHIQKCLDLLDDQPDFGS